MISLTLGLSGFFMGLRQTELASADSRPRIEMVQTADKGSPEIDVPVAPLYAELPSGKLRLNKDWVVHLATLKQPAPEAQYVVASLSPADLARLRATRTTRRQYDGAPPVAPHPLDQLTPVACLECHGKPTKIGNTQVSQISHPVYTNCIQCHVSSAGPSSTWKERNVALSEGNSFSGKEQSGQGTRAYVGAPPAMPHTTWMRDDCMSCHGPGGTVALRTSHPNRQSCTQCHAVNAALDSRLASGLPPPLPISDWKTDSIR
ncbi:MAG: hypothetical protein IPP19_16745 [Verrucomicrobia bacterium]|nr:hypothetical protein [Verrucomicrobiota bacterium]